MEKDTSEDATVVDILRDCMFNRVRRTSDSIYMIVLEMFGKIVEGERIVSKGSAGSIAVNDVSY
jgi:hypothetical protein